MPQEWYDTVDEYALALWKTNVAFGTRGWPGLLARVGISSPIGAGIVLGANTIALAALVARDPSGLRAKGGQPGIVSEVASNPELQAELMTIARQVKDFIGEKPGQQALVKDDEGLIEVV